MRWLPGGPQQLVQVELVPERVADRRLPIDEAVALVVVMPDCERRGRLLLDERLPEQITLPVAAAPPHGSQLRRVGTLGTTDDIRDCHLLDAILGCQNVLGHLLSRVALPDRCRLSGAK